jgi:hypothetical protein
MVVKKSKKRTGFSYKKRSTENLRKRQNQGGGNREGFLKSEFKVWTPKSGTNWVRILPPTWDGAEHYGLDCHVHYNIGLDSSAFICLDAADEFGYDSDEPCPCCALRAKESKRGNEKQAEDLRARKRVLVWMIDRDKESEGPQLWPMPWTIDRDLAQRSVHKKSGEVYAIDDPEDGYDISFEREGANQNTKYTAIDIERKPSPLCDDRELEEDWLAAIEENPLPDCVILADADHIEEELSGGYGRKEDKPERSSTATRRGRRDEDEEDEEERATKRSRAASRRGSRDEDDEDDGDERPARRRSRARDEDEDDDEEEKPVRRRRSRAADEDEDDEDEKPKRRKTRSRDVDEDEDDDEDEKPARKRRRAGVDDEDEEEEALRGPSRKQRATKADDDEDDEDEKPARKSRRSRLKEEDEDEEDAEEEGEEKPKRKAKAGGLRERLRSLKRPK